MSIRNFVHIITILLSISFSDGFEFPKYPEILTPNEQYSALANTDHAAIQYGDNDKAKVLTNQFKFINLAIINTIIDSDLENNRLCRKLIFTFH